MRPLLSLSLVAVFVAALPADDKLPAGFKELYKQDFAKPEAASDFVFSDPAVWKYGTDKDGKGYLDLHYDRKAYKSTYSPKNRSPIHIALIANKKFTDFVLDCELQSTTEAYGHQDMCLYFGFTEPQKFYYVHIARAADMNAHNVFVVNEAPRKNFAKETTKGINWKKDAWHKVRITRDTASGAIEVFFDDLTKPIMKAEDKTFGAGYIGFGSFDDTGRVRNIRVSGPKAEDRTAEFFKPLEKDK
ncbi:MAG: hypothetical protein ACKODX_09975 [Gemmata sp.]